MTRVPAVVGETALGRAEARLRPARVGRLTEPTDQERTRFLALVADHRAALAAAHTAALALARHADRAAVYTAYGADVPETLRTAIHDLDKTWTSARRATRIIPDFS